MCEEEYCRCGHRKEEHSEDEIYSKTFDDWYWDYFECDKCDCIKYIPKKS